MLHNYLIETEVKQEHRQLQQSDSEINKAIEKKELTDSKYKYMYQYNCHAFCCNMFSFKNV